MTDGYGLSNAWARPGQPWSSPRPLASRTPPNSGRHSVGYPGDNAGFNDGLPDLASGAPMQDVKDKAEPCMTLDNVARVVFEVAKISLRR